MTNQPITVVLPMYNAESLIQRSVREVLELAHSFTSEFCVVVVDNGSTDETYETACELSSVFPQIRVLRQPVQQGLQRILELVRKNFRCEAVVVHDGVTPIDVGQLRRVLNSQGSVEETTPRTSAQPTSEQSASGSRRFGALRTLQANMESAHGTISGFRWMRLEEPMLPRRCVEATSTTVVTAMPNMPLTQSTLPIS